MALVTGSLDGQQYQYDDGQPDAPAGEGIPYDPNGFNWYIPSGGHIDPRTQSILSELQKNYKVTNQSLTDTFNSTYNSINPLAGYNDAQFGNALLSAIGQNHGIDVSKYLLDPNSPAYQQAAAAGVQRDANIKAHDDAAHGSLKEFIPFALSVAAMAAGGNYFSGLGGGGGAAGGVGFGADGAVGVGGEGLAGLGGGAAGSGIDLGTFQNLLTNPANVQVAGDATGIGTVGEGAGYLNTGLNGATSLSPTATAASTGGLQLTGGNAALGLNLTPEAVGAFNAGLSPGLAAAAGIPSAAALASLSNTAATGAGLTAGGNAAGSFLTGNGGATTLSNLATGGVGGPATAAATAAGSGSAISRVLNGTATADDWLSLAGKALPGLIGAFGANKQSGALDSLAQQFAAYGAPSRARYEASMSPGFDPTTIPGYSGALDTASQSILRKLSATDGNPFGNPGGLIEANKQIVNGTALPAVQEYQRLNAGTGGLAQLASAYPGAATNATNSGAGVYNALGAAAADVFNPQDNSLAGLLKKLTAGFNTGTQPV